MKTPFLFVLLLILVGCATKSDQYYVQPINENWQFKEVEGTQWNEAIVPGEVHSDLLRLGKIDDPFQANNELDVQWISERDWEYKTSFSIDQNVLTKEHVTLRFKGLDTYARIFLNDVEIAQTNNAFRTYEIDIKKHLKKKNNLRIVFEKTSTYEQVAQAKLSYKMPVEGRVFTRKPQFHYGWDWGPVLITSGISRPIELLAWNATRIDQVYIKQNQLSDEVAKLQAQISLTDQVPTELKVQVYVNNELQVTRNIEKNSKSVSVPFDIQNPKKWWPHNIGDPYLYDIHVVIKNGNDVIDQFNTKKGLRTARLVTEKDSIGETFYFEINGVPVYAKGANYIPQHSFQSQVQVTDYERLLNDVVGANMNMLRVWGGGIYEEDIFYELCDEKGIMVWQDFMFACAMYPGDEAYIENVKQEAIDQVKRLRHHPSLVLWCGNNENNEAWHRWGWQTGRTEEEKAEIWEHYQAVFNRLLPEVVSEFHEELDYWESSPRYGRGDPLHKTEGDAHDWFIWHDEYPFEHLIDNVPRFMSEFGFQAFPSYEAIQYINKGASYDIQTKAFETHQKHPRGYSIIKNYMERDYPVPDKSEDYVYISQLMQANGMVMGFEAQRRAKPYNMGTLYWQLNDCWPVISWSSIDYLGNWKAMHFKTKKAFEDVLISSKLVGNKVETYVVNDNFEEYDGVLYVDVLDFYGKVLKSEKVSIDVKENSSELKHVLDVSSFGKNDVFLRTRFRDKEVYFYLDRHKNLKLPAGEVDYEIVKKSDRFEVKLSSKTLQKDVFLFTKSKGRFSDNFFDILPNKTKIVYFFSDEKDIKELKIKTFNEILNSY